MIAARPEFVRRNPVATKRAVRAILKATDICAREPERAARYIVAKGYEPRYEIALEVFKGSPTTAGAPITRKIPCASSSAPARGGHDQVEPAEAHRSGYRLAISERVEAGAEGLT